MAQLQRAAPEHRWPLDVVCRIGTFYTGISNETTLVQEERALISLRSACLFNAYHGLKPRAFRKRFYKLNFSLLRAGIALLDGLRNIHEAGYIHRDVKPANFVLGARDQTAETGTWKAIDFGLARRYVAPDGSVIPLRAEFKEFRGSTTYASVNAHKKMDLGELSRIAKLAHLEKKRVQASPPLSASSYVQYRNRALSATATRIQTGISTDALHCSLMI